MQGSRESKTIQKSNKSRQKRLIILLNLVLLIIIFIIVLMVFGLDNDLVVTKYSLESEKISEPLKIVYLSDLHSCYYGEDQEDLVDTVIAQEPDVILWGGDIVDDDFVNLNPQNAYIAMRRLAEVYPSYYVSGNHELWSWQIDSITSMIERIGVEVLSAESVELTAEIILHGIDDPDIDYYKLSSSETLDYDEQLDAISDIDQDKFNILLAHRPERIEEYAELAVDLTISGHAHGGQWRLPGINFGLFSPNQGLFPKYTSGFYEYEEMKLLVGRGLSRESTSIPRIFNPPEVIVLILS